MLMFCNKLGSFLSIGLIWLCLATGGVAKPIRIVAITEDFSSIAKSVGGEFVTVSPLIKGSKNLHDINPKPSMVIAVKSADLLIRLGMKQDSWIDGLIQVARNNRVFFDQKG